MKKRLILASAILTVGLVGSVVALNAPQPSGADTSPIVGQVQQNTDELANHEARITNTENNVKDLQSKTDTAPSSSNVAVPVVATPASSPQAAPTPPVTVTAFQQVPLDDQGNIDCLFTYSDGTTYQWHWQTVNPQGSWEINGNPANGYHWVPTTSNSGTCNQTSIGQTK